MKRILTAVAIEAFTVSAEMKTYYVEIPQTGAIFIVKAEGRADAMTRIGATAFSEEEFKGAFEIYNDTTNMIFEGGEFQKPKFIDLTRPRKAGPITVEEP